MQPSAGWTTADAQRLLAQYGPNEVAPSLQRSPFRRFLAEFVNPLILILLFAGGLSAALGQVTDAVIIATMVLLGAGINFLQTYRSEQAAHRLRASVAPQAATLRDGQWHDLPAAQLVPGDLIRLTAGDLVPADAEIIQARDLHLQEAALTGESLPVAKEAPGEKLFLGTSVVSGTATAHVTATGRATVFGDIAQRLELRPEETDFERGLRNFGVLILRATVFLVFVVLTVNAALHRDFLESLLFAVALAVGLTPEFLPVITSVTLANGAVRMAAQGVIVKRLSALQDFGSIDVLCSDKTGTLTSGIMELERQADAKGQIDPSPAGGDALWLAHCNSQHETGIRSPFDAAILKHDPPAAQGYRKLDEIPFDFERRVLSVVVEKESDPSAGPLLITKGAPEAILSRCHLPVEDHHRFTTLCEDWGRDGLRVLAVASRRVAAAPAYSAADERDLDLVGFLGFADQPLPDSNETLAELRRDGIQVKVLTGDSVTVTEHVCRQVGLDTSSILTGEDVDRLDEPALAHMAEVTAIFARVSPAQKNRILLALKHRGHVVGFLGDGINDAPSLHAADVGIAAAGATDVARDAADIVMAHGGLRVLHTGIVQGRRASVNLQKYILMGTSSNFGNMLSMAAATAFLPFLPMLPTQILLNNFLYDLSQITIPGDRVDAQDLRRPRRWDIKLVRNFMLLIGPISSLYDFLTFYVLLRVLHATQEQFHTGWFVESLATQTLVLFVIRTTAAPWSLKTASSRPSPALTATILGVVLIALLLPFTPLSGPLGFVPLPWIYYLFLAAATITYLGLVEFAKRLLFRETRPPTPAV